MFDLATRPQPNAADAAAVFGVPFDLRLAPPSGVQAYPFTDYNSPTGAPQPGLDTLVTYAMELDDTLQTAVVISLFTDRRAGRDDALPFNETDRRGWVGDEFMSAEFDATADAWGSALWLCYSGKVTSDLLETARFAAQEALAWLVRDQIASRVTVQTLWVGERKDRLAVRPTIYKPDQVQPVYDVLWGTSVRRWASA